MTISPERVEAEIAAEVRRIEAWNNTLANAARGLSPPLTPKWIRELADYQVRKRLQVEDAPRRIGVEDAQIHAILEAAKAVSAAWESNDLTQENTTLIFRRIHQLRAAIAAVEGGVR